MFRFVMSKSRILGTLQAAVMASGNLMPKSLSLTFEPSQPTGQKIIVLHKEPSEEEECAAYISWIEAGIFSHSS